MDERISVIIPIYNTKDYLENCIESVRAWTYRNLEIILVDDGSTDGCYEVCESYRHRDDRIVVIHKENQGLISARKAGVLAATGEYVGFVDSDDKVEPGTFEKMYQTAKLHQADIVADGLIQDRKGELKRRKNALPAGVYRTPSERLCLYRSMMNCGEYFVSGIFPYLWNKLIRRELAVKHLLTVDERIRIGEDAAGIYPLMLLADCIVVTENCSCHYCIRNTSMVWQRLEMAEEFSNVKRLYRYLREKFTEYGWIEVLNPSLKRYIMNVVLVRAFSRYVNIGGRPLFPFRFREERKCRSFILYGAGAFGKSVRGYLESREDFQIEHWVDRDYQVCRKLGVPVEDPDSLSAERKVEVLIAVLDKRAADEIKTGLLEKGFLENQLVWLDIAEEEENRILVDLLTDEDEGKET